MRRESVIMKKVRHRDVYVLIAENRLIQLNQAQNQITNHQLEIKSDLKIKNMDKEKFNEHVVKEMFKHAVDNNPRYPEDIKRDLKAIIDAGKSYREIYEGTLAYFAGQMFK